MIKKSNIILVRKERHCKSCINVIEQENRFTITGVIDVGEKKGDSILDYSMINFNDDFPINTQQNYYYLISVGQIKSSYYRVKLYNKT